MRCRQGNRTTGRRACSTVTFMFLHTELLSTATAGPRIPSTWPEFARDGSMIWPKLCDLRKRRSTSALTNHTRKWNCGAFLKRFDLRVLEVRLFRESQKSKEQSPTFSGYLPTPPVAASLRVTDPSFQKKIELLRGLIPPAQNAVKVAQFGATGCIGPCLMRAHQSPYILHMGTSSHCF